MRIAIVAQQMRQPVPGGIGTYIRGLVGGLDAGGSEDLSLSFVASRADGPDPLLDWGHVPRAWLGLRPTVMLWEMQILRAPKGYDVVHATSLAFPSPRKRSEGVTTMFVHDLAWRTHPDLYPERGRRFHERALMRTLASRSALLVPSVATADALLASGVAHTRVHVVGEGSDHLPVIARQGEGEYLLAVSTREPRKNLRRLVEAYALIRNRLPEPWPLYIVGPRGWDDRAGNSPLGDEQVEGVEMLGPVTDQRLAELFSRARTFAYVPLAEGFGLPRCAPACRWSRRTCQACRPTSPVSSIRSTSMTSLVA
jgi:glycosyltransferase involved in cell wall biosynthesis